MLQVFAASSLSQADLTSNVTSSAGQSRSRELACAALSHLEVDLGFSILLAVEANYAARTLGSDESLRQELLASHLRLRLSLPAAGLCGWMDRTRTNPRHAPTDLRRAEDPPGPVLDFPSVVLVVARCLQQHLC